jgi:hypothetical protein
MISECGTGIAEFGTAGGKMHRAESIELNISLV